MRSKLRSVVALACAAVCALAFTACGADGLTLDGNSRLLGAPKAVEKVDHSALRTDEYRRFAGSVEAFNAKFAAAAYAEYGGAENFAVSPVSVYMALAMAAECAAGDTRQELLNALDVTHDGLKTHFSTLYRSLEVEHVADGKVTGLLDLSDSIWVDDAVSVKQPCITDLSEKYYAYSYSADFARDNAEANKAVRDFIKKQTRGLIDRDLDMSERTVFALVNALYLKTVWNMFGDDLPFADGQFDFTAKDGTVTQTRLLQGAYNAGRAAEFDTFTAFYTSTAHGYKIKFLLPKLGYGLDEVFCAENIAAVNAISDHREYDAETDTRYVTRVLFPEYKCKFDGDISSVLEREFGVDLLFKNPDAYPEGCDFSTLTDRPCFCESVRHVTDLTVDKKGIEGAAVTVMIGAGAAPPTVTVEADFTVDRAFGFIITDSRNVTLFSGAVHNV